MGRSSGEGSYCRNMLRFLCFRPNSMALWRENLELEAVMYVLQGPTLSLCHGTKDGKSIEEHLANEHELFIGLTTTADTMSSADFHAANACQSLGELHDADTGAYRRLCNMVSMRSVNFSVTSVHVVTPSDIQGRLCAQ